MHKILLITSSVNVIATDAKLKDVTKRESQMYDALNKILSLSFFEKIFVIDGSGYNFNNASARVNSSETTIVMDSFVQDKIKTEKFGKSYGEILIYDFFLKKYSAEIKNKSIYKITARWSIDNFIDILNDSQKLPSLFYLYYPKIINFRTFTHTCFFKIQTDLLMELVTNTMQKITVYDNEIILEEIFFNFLNETRKDYISIPYPKYSGLSGTTAKEIKTGKIKYWFENFLSTKLSLYAFVLPSKGVTI